VCLGVKKVHFMVKSHHSNNDTFKNSCERSTEELFLGTP
jgi:hypothetical protein